MSNTEPPKRTESTELTVVRPRDSLAPHSTVPGPTIAQLSDVERALRDAEDDLAVDVDPTLHSAAQDATETLVPCPSCAWCSLCAGGHMVSHERRSKWLDEHPRHANADDEASQGPESEPPPEAA